MGLFDFFKKKTVRICESLEDFYSEDISAKYDNSFNGTGFFGGAPEVYREKSIYDRSLYALAMFLANKTSDRSDKEFAMFSSLSTSTKLERSYLVESNIKNGRLLPSDYIYSFLKAKYNFQDEHKRIYEYNQFSSGYFLLMWVAVTDNRVGTHTISFLDSLEKDKNPLLNYYDKIIEYYKSNVGEVNSFEFANQLSKYWSSFYAYIATYYVAEAACEGVDVSGEEWLYNKEYFDCCSVKFTKKQVEEIKSQCKNKEWLPKINLYEIELFDLSGSKYEYEIGSDEKTVKKEMSQKTNKMVVSCNIVKEIM